MLRITTILILLTCLVVVPVVPASAAIFGTDTLVTVDENSYSIDDFKRWWEFWKEGDEPFLKTPDPYIDWLLLRREAERMQLADTPTFKRKTETFLLARSLPMLQHEAVTSQITLTDADIMARYEEQHLPHWLVQRLEFEDEGAAMTAWQELVEGTLTMDDVLERDAEQGGAIDSFDNWVWPKKLDPGWVAIFQKLSVGEFVDPNEYGKGRVLYFLKEEKGFDEKEFDLLRVNIRKDLVKEQRNVLTRKLLAELRYKYQVNIDRERLAALDINGANDTFTDAPIVTTSKENISEQQFITVIRRVVASRPTAAHDAADEEKVEKLKIDTVNNMISQMLTNWEALDRHYEKKEPFKWNYEFNYDHRLVTTLESLSLVPETQNISEEQIKLYYEENIDRYTQPTMVKLYIFDETQGPLDQIWAEVAIGKNFQQAVVEILEKGINPQEIPANHLDPEVKKVVEKLVDGETSQIFKAQDVRLMVHLVEKTPEVKLPLNSVKDSIRATLKEKEYNQARNTYLDTLKSLSEIHVNLPNWEKIQKELGGS